MLSGNTPVRRRTFAFTEYQRAKSSKTDFYITQVSRPDAIIEPYPTHGAPSSTPPRTSSLTTRPSVPMPARLRRELRGFCARTKQIPQ
jgi:hypothetical protein